MKSKLIKKMDGFRVIRLGKVGGSGSRKLSECASLFLTGYLRMIN